MKWEKVLGKIKLKKKQRFTLKDERWSEKEKESNIKNIYYITFTCKGTVFIQQKNNKNI